MDVIKFIKEGGLSICSGLVATPGCKSTAEDPRMVLIKIQLRAISYWKSTASSLLFMKEAAQASFMRQITNTYVQRQLVQKNAQEIRKEAAGSWLCWQVWGE